MSVADTETISVKTTAEFETAVTQANGNATATTIQLAGGIYKPEKPLKITKTKASITFEGPSSADNVRGETAKLDGSGVEPFPSQLLVISSGATLIVEQLGSRRAAATVSRR